MISGYGRLADCRRRPDSRQMLSCQTWRFTFGPNIFDPDRLGQDRRQGQGSPQNLPSSLAIGAINNYHDFPSYPVMTAAPFDTLRYSGCGCHHKGMAF
jgi:hypothetical protein